MIVHTDLRNHAVIRLWDLFDRRDFQAVGPLLTDRFVMNWPQSGERIVGRDHFIAINENYPGHWRCQVFDFLEQGDQVVTRTDVSDGIQHVVALSFFTLKNGLIDAATEYWPQSYAAPSWRAQWVEYV